MQKMLLLRRSINRCNQYVLHSRAAHFEFNDQFIAANEFLNNIFLSNENYHTRHAQITEKEIITR